MRVAQPGQTLHQVRPYPLVQRLYEAVKIILETNYPHTAAVMTSRPQGIRYHILSAFHRKRQSKFLRRLHRANPSTQSFFYPGLQPTGRGPVTVHGYVLRYTDESAP